MTASATPRTNLTGSKLHPDETKSIVEATHEFPPSSSGNESQILSVRAEYMRSAEPIGSIPLPVSANGGIASIRGDGSGQQPMVFMDRLGERLAFERSGARLYEAFLGKVANAHGPTGAVDINRVQHFLEEELEHFQLLMQCVDELGGDPTAVTPAADIVAVQSHGLVQVVTDARTTVNQCLCAILTVELVDKDGWELLAALARGLGHDDMARDFEHALQEESEHLTTVRDWVKTGTMREAGVAS